MPEISEIELPTLTVTVSRHPNGTFRYENLNPEIPDHIKICIADIFLNWGAAETKLTWFANKIFYDRTGPNLRKLSFYGRYRILRDLVRSERGILRDGIPSFWKLLAIDKPLVTRVRNSLAHGHAIGVWRDPANWLAVAKIEDNGLIGYHSFPFEALEKTKTLLKFSVDAIDAYHLAMLDFLDRTREEASNEQPSAK